MLCNLNTVSKQLDGTLSYLSVYRFKMTVYLGVEGI